MVADISMHSMFMKKRRGKEGESKDERIKLRVLPPCLPIFFYIKYLGNSIIKAYSTWISIHRIL